MKFLETLNGTFINTDYISHFGHDLDAQTMQYSSHVYLANGDVYDLIDVGYYVDKSGKENPIDSDILITWHRLIAEKIQKHDGVITQELLDGLWTRVQTKLDKVLA